jgi:nickel/cobalt transporter (NicO) family protein
MLWLYVSVDFVEAAAAESPQLQQSQQVDRNFTGFPMMLDLSSFFFFAHLDSPLPIDLNAEPTLGAILGGMAIAFSFGALHALEPGHGKTMVSAYLVGSRGTAKHAVILGITTTITHTLTIFSLGLVALFASKYLVPEQLYPVLSVMSGLMVCAVGAWLLKQRLGHTHSGCAHSHEPEPHSHESHSHESHSHDHNHEPHAHESHSHDHNHEPHAHESHASHEHSHTHSHNSHTHSCGHVHEVPNDLSLSSLITLGVSGGLVPCPSALVMLLGAITVHQTLYGLLLVGGFSLGLAAVLITLGLVVIYAKQRLEQFPVMSSKVKVWMDRVPVLSAIVVLLTGIGLTVFAVV